ncbi:MAG: ComF family protein [Tepidiformaceae bacterium]
MLARLRRTTLDLLFPLRCVHCGRFGTLLCVPCESAMESASGPGRCPHCRARWQGSGNCPRCFGLQSLDGVLAPFEMTGAARKVVHALKYQHVRPVAEVMAAPLLAASTGHSFDAFFSVPLHRSRERERGFNQSELLVRAAGWPPPTGSLTRSRRTSRQVGLHEGERRANVAGAFQYRGPALDGLRVALVDDVVTTGATVQECARVLKAEGAREVWAIAYARASYNFGPANAAIEE